MSVVEVDKFDIFVGTAVMASKVVPVELEVSLVFLTHSGKSAIPVCSRMERYD